MLNSKLYHTLKQMYKKVEIAKPGMPMTYTINSTFPYNFNKQDGGEEYRICCPECSDRTFRLYINHRFGTREEKTGKLFNKFSSLMHCFNEECNLSKVREDIISALQTGDCKTFEYPEETKIAKIKIPHPGKTIPIQDLKSDHPAITYLEKRGYSKEDAIPFELSYCLESEFKVIEGRIIFPLIKNGVYLGFQARYLEDPPKKSSLPVCKKNGWVLDINTETKIITIGSHTYPILDHTRLIVRVGDYVPEGKRFMESIDKYWTAPGTKKSHTFFGWDLAKDSPYVVVMEGPLDVLKFGPPAIAMFGKAISPIQTRLLLSKWSDKKIIVLLDADAKKYSDNAVSILKPHVKDEQVFSINLPEGRDPGDLDRKYLHKLVEDKLRS